MKISHIVIIGILVLLAASILFLLTQITFTPTANVVQGNNKSTWTTAICNENNECADYLVSCENGQVTGMKSVSAIVKMSDNWQDTRENKRLCGH